MNWLREHRAQAARVGIGAGIFGAVLLLVLFVNLYQERKATEVMIASRYETESSEAEIPSEAHGVSEEVSQAPALLSDAVVQWDGKTYRRNTYMKAILCMGVDRDERLTETEDHGKAGQADSVFLAAWDTARNHLTLLMIPRDSMTELTPVNRDGTLREEELDHITLAFSYGDGSHESCENMVREVSEMFFDFPIDHYIAVDLGIVDLLNDAVGGVTVTVPAGMEAIDPEFQEGSQVTLQGEQAEAFVRYRDITKDHSALFRIFRGQEFITGFFEAAQEMAKKDSQTVPKLFELAEDHMLTDMGKDQYMKMAADLVADGSLTKEDFKVLPGNAIVTETYDEYRVDETGMVKVLLELFYREA